MTMPSRPQTEIGCSAAVASSMKGHSDPTISPEIRRLRIKLQLADPRSYIMDQAIEPAMRYVQKIKQRCDPDTYQQFLDILSDYHHMPDSDEKVSRQIAILFKNEPDLYTDFCIFMPNTNN